MSEEKSKISKKDLIKYSKKISFDPLQYKKKKKD